MTEAQREIFQEMTGRHEENLMGGSVIQIEDLNVWRGKQSPKQHVLKDLSIRIGSGITAIVGPSGSGKSTLLRCINRMMEEEKGAVIKGRVLFDGENIYSSVVDPVKVKRKIGMVFQKANPFPTMSIEENSVAGLSLNRGLLFRGKKEKERTEDKAEEVLKRVGLWDEVENSLGDSGVSLSGGQQQRLCIARALAVNPKVLLMDEPCSALDPIATFTIENLLKELAKTVPIIIVTHNFFQAGRISDRIAVLVEGELVEYDTTENIFIRPKDKRTGDFIMSNGAIFMKRSE